jgi:hypothetical protein
MGTSKISVNLQTRSFDIEVPDERVDEVLARLEALLQLSLVPESSPALQNPDEEGETPSGEASQTHGEGAPSGGERPETSRRRGKASASAQSYEIVELGLTPEQRQDLRTFYADKAADGQNERVAVLGYKLKEYLKKAEFSANDIHSAFKVVDEPTPKNLRAVFGNMKRDGRAGYSGNKIVINSHTEDYVAYHMGKKKKATK